MLMTVVASMALAAIETKKAVNATNVSTQLAGGTLAILAPLNGETWEMATKREIRWTPGQMTGNGHIVLDKPGECSWTVGVNVPLAGGSWKWQVGRIDLNMAIDAPTGGGYKIRIVNAADGKPLGASQGTFTIAPAAAKPRSVLEIKNNRGSLQSSLQLSAGTLAILAPKNGETWEIGTMREIRWTPGQFAGNGHIDLSKLGGGHAGNLEINVPLAGGSWKWKVGTMKTGSLAPTGSGYLIRIVGAADGKMLGTSPGTFTLAPAQPLLQMIKSSAYKKKID